MEMELLFKKTGVYNVNIKISNVSPLYKYVTDNS